MAELVSSILLSQYVNENNGVLADEAVQQHALDLHILADDAARQQRPLPPAPNGDDARRLRRSVYRRGRRAITFHVVQEGAAADARPFWPAEDCGPIMRRASWVEAPFPAQNVLGSGFGLPRTPLRVLSIGPGHRNHHGADHPKEQDLLDTPVAQRPLSSQQLELGGGREQDVGAVATAATAVDAPTRGPMHAQALARTMRGAWGGAMHTSRGARAWGAHGPLTAGPLQQLIGGDASGLAPARPPGDATAVISIVDDPLIGGELQQGGVGAASVGLVGGAGALSQEQHASGTRPLSAMRSGGSADGAAASPGLNPGPTKPTDSVCNLSNAAAAVASILWPATPTGHPVSAASGPAVSYSMVGLPRSPSPTRPAAANAARRPYSAAARVGLLPGQVEGAAGGGGAAAAGAAAAASIAADAAAAEADRILAEEADFLMPKAAGNSRLLSGAVSKELNWWIMSSQDYDDGIGGGAAAADGKHGGLRRRRRHWQRTSESGAADGGLGGADWSAVTKAAATHRSAVGASFGTTSSGLSMAAAGAGTQRWRRCAWWCGLQHWRFSIHNFWSRLDGCLPLFLPSAYRDCWDGVLLALLLYTAAVVPLQAGFQGIQTSVLDWFDWGILGMFWVDIFVQFRSAYISETGELVRDTAQIAEHYSRTWFAMDLTSSLPWAEVLGAALANHKPHWASLMQLLRLVRLLKLVRLLQFLDRFRYANYLRLARLFALMIFVAHWTCCAWHGLSEWLSGWPWLFDTLRGGPDPGSVASEYSLAIYSSFVLVVGSDNLDAHNNVERVFFICMLIVGAVIYALIVSNMAVLATNLNALSTRYKLKASVAADALRYVGAPQRFKDRVVAYYDFLAHHEHPGPEADAFLSELPRGLVEDIKWCLYSGPFHHLSLFSGCDEPFMAAVQARLTLVAFTPGEEIYRAGELGQHMYVVRQGTVLLRSELGDMLRVVVAGECFSELALLPDLVARRHICTAVCGSATDLVALAGRDLAAACREHPDSGALVQERLMQLLEDRIQGTEWTWFIEKVLVPCHLYDEAEAAGHLDGAAGSDTGTGGGGGGGAGAAGVHSHGHHRQRGGSGGGGGGSSTSSADVDANSRTWVFVRKLQERRQRASSSLDKSLEQRGLFRSSSEGFGSRLSIQTTDATAHAAAAAAAAAVAAAAAAAAANATAPWTLAARATDAANAAPPQLTPVTPTSPPQPPSTPTSAVAVAALSTPPADAGATATASQPAAVWALPCVPAPGLVTAAATASAGATDGRVCVSGPSWTSRRLRLSASAAARRGLAVAVPTPITAPAPVGPAAANPAAVDGSVACDGGGGSGAHPPEEQRSMTLLLPGMASPNADEKPSYATATMAVLPAAPLPPRSTVVGSRPGSVESVASSLQLLRLGTVTSTASAERRTSLERQQQQQQQQVMVRIDPGSENGAEHGGDGGRGGRARGSSGGGRRLGSGSGERGSGSGSGPTPSSLTGRESEDPQHQEEESHRRQSTDVAEVPSAEAPAGRRQLVRGGGAVTGVGSSRRMLRTMSDLVTNIIDRLRDSLRVRTSVDEGPRASTPSVTAASTVLDRPPTGDGAGPPSPTHRFVGRRQSAQLATSYLLSVTQDLPAEPTDSGGGAAADDHGGFNDGDILGPAVSDRDSGGSKGPKGSQGASLESLESVVRFGPSSPPSPPLPAHAALEASWPSVTSMTAAARAGECATARVRRLRRSDGSNLRGRWLAAVQDIRQQAADGDGGGGGGERAADGRDRASGSSTGSTRVTVAAVATAAAASTFLPDDDGGRLGGGGGIPSLVLRRSRSRVPVRQASTRALAASGGSATAAAAAASTVRRNITGWLAADGTDYGTVPSSPARPLPLPPRPPTLSDPQFSVHPTAVQPHGGVPQQPQANSPGHSDPRVQLRASLMLLVGAFGVDLSKFQTSSSSSPGIGCGAAAGDGAATAAVAKADPQRAMSPAASGDGAIAASVPPHISSCPTSRGSGGGASVGGAAPAMTAEALLSQPCSRRLLLALTDAVVRREGAAVPAVQEMLQRHGTEVRAATEGLMGKLLGSMAEGVEAAEQSMVNLSDSLVAANRRLAAIERSALESSDGVLAGGLLRHLSRDATRAFDRSTTSDDDDDLYGDDDTGVIGATGSLLRSAGSAGSVSLGTAGVGGGTEDMDALTAALMRLRTPLHLSMEPERDPIVKCTSSGLRDDDQDPSTRGHPNSAALASGGGGGIGGGSHVVRRTSKLSFGTPRPLARAITTGGVFESGPPTDAAALAVGGAGEGLAAAPGHVRKCTSSVAEILRETGSSNAGSGYSTAAHRRSLDMSGGGERLRQAAGGDGAVPDVAAVTAAVAAAAAGSPIRDRRRSKRISQSSVECLSAAAAGADAGVGRGAFHSQFSFPSSTGTISGRPAQVPGQGRFNRSRRASLVMMHAGLLASDGAGTGATSTPSSPQTAGLANVRRRTSYVAVLDDKVVADGGGLAVVGPSGGASRHTSSHGVAPSERPGARRATIARSTSHAHGGGNAQSPNLARSRTSTSEMSSLLGAIAAAVSTGGRAAGGGDVSVHGPASRPGSRHASQAGSRRASRAGDSRATSRRGSQSSVGWEESAGPVSEGGEEGLGQLQAR